MKDKINKIQYALEIFVFNPDNNFQTAKDYFNDKEITIEKAESTNCDIISLKFNLSDLADISDAKKLLKSLLPKVKKPLMINGSNNDDIDKVLIPELIKILDRECIIASANENTYKEITPIAAKGNHRLVLKSPIDINLCKELNILVTDIGFPKEKIIADPDIGGLGYCLEYGYSIMEKIKLENDEYLDMPIISFAAYESLKTKEAKTDEYSKSWGDLKTRTRMIELAAASAVKAAGADIIVMYNPDNIRIMKGLEE